MKKCSKCNIEKEDIYFYKDKNKCKDCCKEYYLHNKDKIRDYYKEYNKEYNLKNKDKIKDYYKNNKDKIKIKSKDYYENNKDKKKEYYENNKDIKKEYRLNNKEKINKYNKEWNINNKDIKKEYFKNNKDKIYKYYKNKYKTDPTFRLISLIRSNFHIRLKLHKNEVTYNYLSDNIPEYIKHLEQHHNWNDNFNWDNFGEIWEVDHIVPVYYFKNILDEQEDDNIKEQLLKICWCKENLQPLWKTTEISKKYGFDVVGNKNKNRNIDFNNEESRLILDKINKVFIK